jgi:hypothetical protein
MYLWYLSSTVFGHDDESERYQITYGKAQDK